MAGDHQILNMAVGLINGGVQAILKIASAELDCRVKY